MLSPDHRRQLEISGILRLPEVVPRSAAEDMVTGVWEVLARRGIDRADPATWPEGLLTKLQALKRSATFGAFDTPVVRAVADELLGSGSWLANGAWGPALVTFPQPAPWVLPHTTWHLDEAGRGDPDHPRLLRLFGYATDVAPQGGGTLVVEGSHELVRRMVAASPGHDAGGSAEVRRRLIAGHPWFRALTQAGDDRTTRLMVDGEEIDGVRVRVVELTAQAGDVVVMLPWTLHNISMNCAAAPRFMVTQTLFRP